MKSVVTYVATLCKIDFLSVKTIVKLKGLHDKKNTSRHHFYFIISYYV